MLTAARRLSDGTYAMLLRLCFLVQRHDDRRKEIEGMMAIVAKADATNKEQVDKVFAGNTQMPYFIFLYL